MRHSPAPSAQRQPVHGVVLCLSYPHSSRAVEDFVGVTYKNKKRKKGVKKSGKGLHATKSWKDVKVELSKYLVDMVSERLAKGEYKPFKDIAK